MKLTQVKGNTYVLEAAWELVPLYKTDDTHCILLDTALWTERDQLEAALDEHRLTPVGIISSHVHPDHSANDRYFQEKLHIPVALSEGEAELCADFDAVSDYFHMPGVKAARPVLEIMILHPDQLIGHEDTSVDFQGVTFRVVHTPGHSPDHISLITPDGVCYAGDALLSGKMLESKIPFNFSHQAALDSYDLFPRLDCEKYILAHYGIYDDVTELAAANRHLILDRAERICSLIDKPMDEQEINTAAFEHFGISSSDPFKLLMLGHNVQSYMPYLLERGDVEAVGQNRYCRTAK